MASPPGIIHDAADGARQRHAHGNAVGPLRLGGCMRTEKKAHRSGASTPSLMPCACVREEQRPARSGALGCRCLHLRQACPYGRCAQVGRANQTMCDSGRPVVPRVKRSALNGLMSTNGVRPRCRSLMTSPTAGACRKLVPGEAGGVQDVRGVRRAPDEGVVVRGHLVQARPAVAQADVEQSRGADAEGFAQTREPFIGVVEVEAGFLVRVRHAHQQAATFAVEEKLVVKSMVKGTPRPIGHGLGEDDLAAQRCDGERRVGHLTDRAGPRPGRADDGARRDRAVVGVHPAGLAAGHVDAGDRDAAEQGGAVAAGAARVAEHDGIRRAVAVVGGVGRREESVGLDQSSDSALASATSIIRVVTPSSFWSSTSRSKDGHRRGWTAGTGSRRGAGRFPGRGAGRIGRRLPGCAHRARC